MSKPAITLKYEEPDNGSSQSQPSGAPGFEQLWGTIRIVSAVPDWTPRGRLEDSLALYVNGSTKRYYVYDTESRAWRYAELDPAAPSLPETKTFAGQVTSGGSAGAIFPSGWSVSKTAAGNYEVTHTLGTAFYTVFAISTDQVYLCVVASQDSGKFLYRSYNIATISTADTSTQFLVLKN